MICQDKETINLLKNIQPQMKTEISHSIERFSIPKNTLKFNLNENSSIE